MQRSRVVVLAAILTAAAVALAVWWASTDDDPGEEPPAAAPSTASTSPPATPASTAAPATSAAPASTAPGSSPSSRPAPDPEQAAVVEEITMFVSEARGLPFTEEVPVEFLPEDDFLARLDELEEEEVDEEARARSEELWKALRLIDADDDLTELIDRAGEGGTLGFYEYDRRAMVVRGEELTPLVRVTLAHELTHALDDQHFGLDRDELDDDSEAEFGFLVLGEGSAEHVAAQYEAALSADEQEALAEETAAFVGDADLDEIPIELLLAIQMPYILGPDLVQTLVDEGGLAALDAAFGDPPTTAEQAFEPEAYLDRDGAVEVPLPPAPVDPVDDGVFGALGLFLLLPGAAGAELAELWAGDSYVQWLEPDGRPCVRIDLQAEGDGADTYETALSAWGDDHGDANVERIGDTVRVTACG